MKKLSLILLFAFGCLTAEASTVVSALVAITNTVGTTNGQTMTVNSDTRTWTNSVFVSATQILTNNTQSGAAGNLLNHVAVYPFSGVQVYQIAPTNIVLRAATDATLTVTLSAGWGTVTYTTNTIAQAIVVRIPIGIESPAEQTNIASSISASLQSSANTNPIPTLPAVTNAAAYQAFLATNGVVPILRQERQDSTNQLNSALATKLAAATNTLGVDLRAERTASTNELSKTLTNQFRLNGVPVPSTDIPTNTATTDGIVLRSTGQLNKVYKTDGSGVPGWRDDATGGSPSFDLVSSGDNAGQNLAVAAGSLLAPKSGGVVAANLLTNVGAISISSAIFTNGISVNTNYWSGPSNSIDLSLMDVYYTTTTACSLTGVVNKLTWQSSPVSLTISNSSASSITVTYPYFFSADGSRSVVITNASYGMFWIKFSPLGPHTNIVVQPAFF